MLSVGYILGDCLEPEADITWSPFDVSHEVVNESRKDRVSNQPSDKRNATKIEDSLMKPAESNPHLTRTKSIIGQQKRIAKSKIKIGETKTD